LKPVKDSENEEYVGKCYYLKNRFGKKKTVQTELIEAGDRLIEVVEKSGMVHK